MLVQMYIFVKRNVLLSTKSSYFCSMYVFCSLVDED